ncbi:lamin tail domain-containing protein [Hymenobacter terrestris]|uniref:Lamin tail domain-containing protein n=1 Tax=Hymenobacter terrestris TaxID=2748310 RepID=A0ABX2Q353_9BACT|nr:lamin tail domain-containing protein [Hymenobacter terrestris]NVO84750.1 lamin tail domain-containing protein [Hymenobacter terrestris]
MRYFFAFLSDQLVRIRPIVLFSALLLLSPVVGWGQSNPATYDLNAGSYEFSGFSDVTSTSYPSAVQGHSFSSEPDATTVVPPTANVVLVTGGSITSGNIRNEGLNGISLLGTNTNNIGAITLALNTTGRAQIVASWMTRVVHPGERINGIRLQYRLGQTGNFTEVAGSRFESNLVGQNASFANIALPEAVNDQPVVQLRWLYYAVSSSGSRTRIGLDDVLVSSSAGPTIPAPIISSFTPATGPVGTVVTIDGENFINGVTVSFNGMAATAVNVVSTTQLSATVPAGSSTGPISVALGSKVGSSSASFVIESLVGKVVISQVYGGGGNAGANYKNDYVELFNRSSTTVSIGGWSVQYASATATGAFTATNILPTSASIPAGGYYLIQLAGSTVGADLPNPDFTGTTRLSAANGKVALANSGTPVTEPTSSNVIDFLGYGTANQSEGGSAANSISVTQAATRKTNGCQDTDNNSADFVSNPPAPRNSGTATKPCETSGTLPVQLLSFGAERRLAGVQVRWATATEQNSASFEVQRSATGQAFRTISTVAAQGNSNSRHEYTLLDQQPLSGTAYYRLHQLDYDGKSSYSVVVSVSAPGEVRVYPNPVQTKLTVELPAVGGGYRILNSLGSVMMAGEVPGSESELDMSSLPSGLYQLEITTSAGREMRKIIKQ